jgi:hypothetical protein
MSWHEAERHCGEFGAGTGGTWRLATIEELDGLFDASQHQSCATWTCRIDPAIALASPYQWSGSARGEGRRVYFDFRHRTQLAPRLRPDLVRGVLCTSGPETPGADPTRDDG